MLNAVQLLTLSAVLSAIPAAAISVSPQSSRLRRTTESDSDAWPFGKWSWKPSMHAPWKSKPHNEGEETSESFRQRLLNTGDVQYSANIKVGGQTLSAIIDTGSFELVVFGKNCSSCGRTSHLYDSRKSKSYVHGGFKGIHSYGSGTTYSEEAFDTVTILPDLEVPLQSFWEVYNANMPILAEDSFQMIFGIGPPASVVKLAEMDAEDVHKELDEYKRKGDTISSSIMSTVRYYDKAYQHAKEIQSVSSNLVLANVSVCLGKSSGSHGYFVWNETATRTNPEKFIEVEVVGDLYWSANLTEIVVDSMPDRGTPGKAMEIGCHGYNNSCSAVIDTGTSLLAAPTAAVDQIRELVDRWVDQGGSCDDLSGLPDLEFKLNGIELSLPPQAYVGKAEGGYSADIQNYMPHLALKRSTPSLSSRERERDCELLIMSMDADSQYGPLWIIGMPFFRKYFTNFEFTQTDGPHTIASTMAFSVADEECRPSASPHDVQATEKLLLGAPRHSHLKVDTNKLLVPDLARRANAHKARGLYGRPFLRI